MSNFEFKKDCMSAHALNLALDSIVIVIVDDRTQGFRPMKAPTARQVIYFVDALRLWSRLHESSKVDGSSSSDSVGGIQWALQLVDYFVASLL